MTADGFIDGENLPHVLSVLREQGPEVTILAGGTDVFVQYLRRDICPTTFLHVRRLQELEGIEYGPQTTVGALTTHWQLATESPMRTAHPALAEAAATVGGRQTQNVGTIAGNVVNASPAADLMPALLVANTMVRLASTTGQREIPVSEFVVGRRATGRQPDELVTALILEPLPERARETYLKVGRRGAMEVALVGIATRLQVDEGGRIADARIGACSVGPQPFRVESAERRLIGSRLDEEAIREAGDLLCKAGSPIDDSRATAAYRRRLLPGVLRQALLSCYRAGRKVQA